MRIILGCSLALAALSALAFAAAQPQPRTIDERIASLEAAVATLDTRLGLESSRQPNLGGESGVALQGRVTTLERNLERLAADVQRASRLADQAARDAASAQRDAMAAQQVARDAALRAR
jgi:hypothetical protein